MTKVVVPAVLVFVAALPLGAQNAQAAIESQLTALVNRSSELEQQGRTADALNLLQQAYQLAASRLGPQHPLTALSLDTLGAAYFSMGQDEKAEAFFQQALAIQQKALAPGDPGIASTLGALASLYDSRGRYDKALGFFQQALAIQEKALSPGDFDISSTLAGMATVYDELGEYDKAVALNQRALAIEQKEVGPEAPETARTLSNLAVIYQEQGAFAKALPLFQRALAIREKILAPDHADIANTLDNLGSLYTALRQYDQALPLFQRALGIRRRSVGQDHPDTARSINHVALWYQQQGDDARALPAFQLALSIREKTLKPDHPELVISLNNLAFSYQRQGQYSNALPLYQRALAIREKILGADHPDTAASLSNVANMYGKLEAYDKAVPIAARALAIYTKTRGPDHLDTAAAMDSLANLYDAQELYEKSLPLHRSELAILEKVRGPDHPDTAIALNNLAIWYEINGAYAKALPLARRALAIVEKAHGPDSFETAGALNTLAELYRGTGAYQEAVPLLRRAIIISERTRGPAHAETGNFVNNLAGVYTGQKAYAEALQLYQRALAIYEGISPGSAATGMALKNLARLYFLRGDYPKSLPLIQRSIATYTKALGPEHPDVRRADHDLHWLLMARASADESSCKEYQSFMTKDRAFRANALGGGVELRIRGAVADAQTEFEELTYCMPASGSAVTLGAQTILETKLRPLEAFRNALEALAQRSDPALRNLLETYFTNNRTLARLEAGAEQSASDQTRQEVARVSEQVETERQEILAKSPQFREIVHDVKLDELRYALHRDQALVEFVLYSRPGFPSPTNPGEEMERYGAFVVTAAGLVWTDLGLTRDIDPLVRKVLLALRRSPDDRKARGVHLPTAGGASGFLETRRICAELYQRVFAPLEKALGDTREIFSAGDGMLRLIPLAALVDASDHYLIEGERLFHQIGTGRDLTLWAGARSSGNRPLIVANPAFGEAASGASFHFGALPGADAEARGILEQFPSAEQIPANAATPQKVLSLESPRFLHLATHAFYEPLADTSTDADPSLRTGIALAGANHGSEGILRANEVAAMNLRGTSLVVISACESGLGEVSYADGVSGLQRSLALAGVRTQVLSLWPVDDRKTSELMIAFYKNLKNGASKSEALRQAQLTMLKSGDPPALWAAFVAYGDPGKL